MPEASQDHLTRLQEQYSQNPEGRLFVHLAEAYRRAGDLERAREVLIQGLAQHSDYLSAHVVLAQVEEGLGRGEAAREVWEQVLRLDEENELALRSLARLEGTSGNEDRARELYGRLWQMGVEDDEIRSGMEERRETEPTPPEPEPFTQQSAAAAEMEEEPVKRVPEMSPEPQVEATLIAPDALPRAAVPHPDFVAPDPSEEPLPLQPRRPVEPQAAPQAVEPPVQPRARQQPAEPHAAQHPAPHPTAPPSPAPRRDPARANGGPVDPVGLSDLLVRLLEFKGSTFRANNSLTRVIAQSIGEELELDRHHLDSLALAALLSDLGGLWLTELESPASGERHGAAQRQSPERRKAAIALQLLQGIALPDGVQDAIRHQHEHWDGSGFPDGLRDEEIPYTARILAVARTCALRLTGEEGERPNNVWKVLDGMQREAGSRFDPVIVSVLRRAFQRRAEHGLGFGLGGRVVIVHQEELRALGLATQLHTNGYVTQMESEIGRARSRLRDEPTEALVLGAHLPGADVARFIREVRSNAGWAQIPVVVVDANDIAQRVELLTAGADVCFSSDTEYKEFKATLDALLRRREDNPIVPAV